MRARKYSSNRRYYDLDMATYTTLARMEASIRGGEELQVDSQGIDITRRVLLDIWYRQQRKEGLSVERLHEMIRGSA